MEEVEEEGGDVMGMGMGMGMEWGRMGMGMGMGMAPCWAHERIEHLTRGLGWPLFQ